MKTGFVTIGIVTFNSQKYLAEILPAVLAQDYPHFEVVILDNASTDGTAEQLLNPPASGTCPEGYWGVKKIKLIQKKENIGFATGHNFLFEESESEFYFCLNPDVLLAPDFLSRLVEVMKGDEKVGSVGGKLLQWDFSNNIEGATAPSRLQDEGDKIIDSTGLKIFPSFRVVDRGQGETDHGQFDSAEEVFGISGAAVLVRRIAVLNNSTEGDPDCDRDNCCLQESSLLFDSQFFIYKEDIDLAFRLRWAGWKNFYEPKAIARHDRTAAQKLFRLKRSLFERRHSFANQFLLVWKNFSSRFSWRIKIITFLRNFGLKFYAIFFEPSLFPAFKMLRQKKSHSHKNFQSVSAKEIEKWMK